MSSYLGGRAGLPAARVVLPRAEQPATEGQTRGHRAQRGHGAATWQHGRVPSRCGIATWRASRAGL